MLIKCQRQHFPPLPINLHEYAQCIGHGFTCNSSQKKWKEAKWVRIALQAWCGSFSLKVSAHGTNDPGFSPFKFNLLEGKVKYKTQYKLVGYAFFLNKFYEQVVSVTNKANKAKLLNVKSHEIYKKRTKG